MAKEYTQQEEQLARFAKAMGHPARIATLDRVESVFFDHHDPNMVKWICNLHR